MDTLPDSSRSIVLCGYGGPEKIEVRNLPFQQIPGESQVLVMVKSCGLNFADVYTRQGLIRDEPGPPFIMGLECAGLVARVGAKVENLKEGDRVIVHTGKTGLQTEYTCIEASCCFLMPESMTWEDAAAFPVNYLTAYFCLFDIGNLRSFQTVLIPSAAGGVGWAATQLAKSVSNVRVIGIASASKHEAIRRNGVDVTIDSHNPQWEEEVKAVCPEGVDIALDFTSGRNFTRTQFLVRDLGRAILLGANDMITGETLSIWQIFRSWWYSSVVKPIDLVLNSRVVAGFHLNHVKTRLPERYRDTFLRLLELYRQNVIKPRIDSVWTFQQITEATNRLSHRKNIGKVVLTPVAT